MKLLIIALLLSGCSLLKVAEDRAEEIVEIEADAVIEARQEKHDRERERREARKARREARKAKKK